MNDPEASTVDRIDFPSGQLDDAIASFKDAVNSIDADHPGWTREVLHTDTVAPLVTVERIAPDGSDAALAQLILDPGVDRDRVASLVTDIR